MYSAPALSIDHRKEIESKVVEALNSLEDELSGTYYPLSGMAEDVRQKLVADHFLFKKGDRWVIFLYFGLIVLIIIFYLLFTKVDLL